MRTGIPRCEKSSFAGRWPARDAETSCRSAVGRLRIPAPGSRRADTRGTEWLSIRSPSSWMSCETMNSGMANRISRPPDTRRPRSKGAQSAFAMINSARHKVIKNRDILTGRAQERGSMAYPGERSHDKRGGRSGRMRQPAFGEPSQRQEITDNKSVTKTCLLSGARRFCVPTSSLSSTRVFRYDRHRRRARQQRSSQSRPRQGHLGRDVARRRRASSIRCSSASGSSATASACSPAALRAPNGFSHSPAIP